MLVIAGSQVWHVHGRTNNMYSGRHWWAFESGGPGPVSLLYTRVFGFKANI